MGKVLIRVMTVPELATVAFAGALHQANKQLKARKP